MGVFITILAALTIILGAGALLLYIDEHFDDDEKERCCRVVGRSNYNANASGGLVYASAHSASSLSYTYVGSRLVFKTRELALYAGKQFIKEWCDFLF